MHILTSKFDSSPKKITQWICKGLLSCGLGMPVPPPGLQNVQKPANRTAMLRAAQAIIFSKKKFAGNHAFRAMGKKMQSLEEI